MARFFKSIELTRKDALALRELVRPFDNAMSEAMKISLVELAKKVYAALIELEREDIDSINVELDESECLLINQNVGHEDWEGAVSLLRQTWAILYELKNDMPPGRAHTLNEILEGMATEKVEDAEGT